jgi:hypothetical protein
MFNRPHSSHEQPSSDLHSNQMKTLQALVSRHEVSTVILHDHEMKLLDIWQVQHALLVTGSHAAAQLKFRSSLS